MHDLSEKITISGAATPYRAQGETIPLVVIELRHRTLEMVVQRGAGGEPGLTFAIWEHTLHEMETLSAALRMVATDALPALSPVPTPKSPLGVHLSLHPSIDIELGYALEDPTGNRARLFCSSKRVGKGGELQVWLAVAIGETFAEVVLAPDQATEIACWLDGHLARLYRAMER